MKTYTAAELSEILKKHENWYFDRPDGSRADLRYANLSGANLSGADLRYANLSGANLSGANLSDVRHNESTGFYALQCPEAGSFIGWKKASGHIVKLEITEDALRSSATTRKCRCSKARVLAIENYDGTPSNYNAIQSNYDSMFVYEVGKVVSVDNFDPNRWHECAPGIHFFITRNEAVNYN